MRKRHLLLLGFLPLLFSCQTYWAYMGADKAFQAGHYREAAFRAVNVIMLDSDNQRAIVLLEKTYPLAVTETLEGIRTAEASKSEFMWTEIADHYILLSRLNTSIREISPLYLKKEKRTAELKLTEFPSRTAVAQEMAAEENYMRGQAFWNEEGREAKKQAFEYFTRCLTYVPGYRDAEEKAGLSKKNATCRILVIPTENRTGQFFTLNAADIAYESILGALSRGMAKKSFSQIIERSQIDRIISEQELQLSDLFESETAMNIGSLLGANTLLQSQITGILYEPPRITTHSRSITRQIPLVSGDPVAAKNPEAKPYREVSGVITYFNRESSLKVTGSYRLVDAETTGIISSEAFTCEKHDAQTWARFTGDEEVLEEQDRLLVRQSEKSVTFESMLLEAVRELGALTAGSVLSELD